MAGRALVLFRVARGGPPPGEPAVRDALRRDRARLGLPAGDPDAYLLTGPYPIELDGSPLDEYVAWET